MTSFFKRCVSLCLFAFFSICIVTLCYAEEKLIGIFDMDKYDQTVSTWIKPSDPHFDQSLLSADMQKKHMDLFYEHYFGQFSPWNEDYITTILKRPKPIDLQAQENTLIEWFTNHDGKPENFIGYGENFRPYSKNWIDRIANNMNIAQFDQLRYQSHNRGIAIDNLHARVLPTEEVHFYKHTLAGQGYPFDNLQMSALWAGTPVYIVAETLDQAWVYVITPDYFGWVKSTGIARVNDKFILNWTKSAKNKLVAITRTQTSLIDEKRKFLLSAYVGSVFPAVHAGSFTLKIKVPAADANGNAIVKHAVVSSEHAAVMPIATTPHHFSTIMTTMIDRPYGWGSLYFYNDCSQELKSLLAPFGIWIPRHSSEQVTVGKMVDMSSESAEKRVSYLMENGKRFLTLIYIGGHVVMYVGNFPNPNQPHSLMAMTYQNIWGLRPNPAKRREVIGKSVLFPMLLSYPEDVSLQSLASGKFFQVSYLDELQSEDTAFMMNKSTTDLKSLMFPETLLNLLGRVNN